MPFVAVVVPVAGRRRAGLPWLMFGVTARDSPLKLYGCDWLTPVQAAASGLSGSGIGCCGSYRIRRSKSHSPAHPVCTGAAEPLLLGRIQFHRFSGGQSACDAGLAGHNERLRGTANRHSGVRVIAPRAVVKGVALAAAANPTAPAPINEETMTARVAAVMRAMVIAFPSPRA